MKNKKGDEKIMALWWFFVIVIMAAGIVFGVLLYFGADIDVRNIEARTLSVKINECLANGNEIDASIFNNDFDLFEKCKINKELFGEGSNYYTRIIVFDINEKNISAERHYGQRSFEKDCVITRSLSEHNFAKCSFLRTSLTHDGEYVNLEIITAADQKGRRVSISQ